MNGLNGAIQLGGWAQFCQRQIGLAAEQFAQFLAVDRNNLGFASAAVIPTGNITCLPPLLEQFFNHPQRNAKTLGNFFAGAFLLIIGGQNGNTFQ
jgi:hypothetical protein